MNSSKAVSGLLPAYSEPEHVVLSTYLGATALIATTLDVPAALSQLYPDGTGVADSDPDDAGPRPIDVAVARIALGQAQNRLPQCAVVSDAGVVLTRRAWRNRRLAIVRPQHVLSINWADSAPGLSWPEAYYVTPLPLYDRCVVTASVDSPDVWGVTDWALGAIPVRSKDLAGSCRRIIQHYWNSLAPNRERDRVEEMWESLDAEGLISSEVAYRMRERMYRAACGHG